MILDVLLYHQKCFLNYNCKGEKQMRKFISTALALLMIFTAVPCLIASAASYPDVAFTPANLNSYVSDGTDGLNRTVTLTVTDEQDGIEALLVEPNPDYVPLDKYSWQTMRTEGTVIVPSVLIVCQLYLSRGT